MRVERLAEHVGGLGRIRACLARTDAMRAFSFFSPAAGVGFELELLAGAVAHLEVALRVGCVSLIAVGLDA